MRRPRRDILLRIVCLLEVTRLITHHGEDEGPVGDISTKLCDDNDGVVPSRVVVVNTSCPVLNKDGQGSILTYSELRSLL